MDGLGHRRLGGGEVAGGIFLWMRILVVLFYSSVLDDMTRSRKLWCGFCGCRETRSEDTRNIRSSFPVKMLVCAHGSTTACSVLVDQMTHQTHVL